VVQIHLSPPKKQKTPAELEFFNFKLLQPAYLNSSLTINTANNTTAIAVPIELIVAMIAIFPSQRSRLNTN